MVQPHELRLPKTRWLLRSCAFDIATIPSMKLKIPTKTMRTPANVRQPYPLTCALQPYPLLEIWPRSAPAP